jgi:sulfatase modifying factor 1
MEVLSTQRRSVPAGTFLMGSERFYDEERPVRQVEVAAFRIDRAPVTNAEFGRFCAETGHVTCAERAGGGLVFRPGAQPDGNWAFTEGASWRHPAGPGSSLDGLERHPVVLVSARDAAAFAAWSGGRLPTEAEWEWAARGGLVSFDYAWGDELRVEGSIPANVWNGAFPFEREGGFDLPLTTPVGSFPDNGFGLSATSGKLPPTSPRVLPEAAVTNRKSGAGSLRLATSSRADRTCAPRTTASVTGQRPGKA